MVDQSDALLAAVQRATAAGRFWSNDRLLKLLIFCVGLMLVVLAGLMVIQQNVIEDRETGRENGHKSRSTACLTVIVDNDRNFPLSSACTEPEVMSYYPPEICVGLGAGSACGSRFSRSEMDDPWAETTGGPPG